MGRLTPDEFRKKYAELPLNLREAYGSVKTTEILEEIGKKHGLLIDQIGELVDETGYVMLGATPPSDYIGKLSAAIGIPREKAKEIAVDVNERVFKPIRDALKQVHKVGEYEHLNTNTRMRANDANKKEAALPQIPSPKLPVPSSQSPVRTLADDIRQATNAPLSPPANLSEERLTKPFSLPRTEKSYTIPDAGEESEEKAPMHTYQMDPYREPTK